MFNSKFIITLIALMLVVFTIYSYDNENLEAFGMLPSRTWYVDKMVAASPEAAKKGDFFSVPNYNAMLSPRFSNVDFGANIRYNMAPYKYRASPCDPLTFSDMATRSYKEDCDQKDKFKINPSHTDHHFQHPKKDPNHPENYQEN